MRLRYIRSAASVPHRIPVRFGMLGLVIGASTAHAQPAAPVDADITEGPQEVVLFHSTGRRIDANHGPGLAVVRSRAVEVDIEALRKIERTEGARLRLDLFEDTLLLGTIVRAQSRSDDRFTLTGTLLGERGGSFALVFQRGAVAADIHVPGEGYYLVRPRPGGFHTIEQVDPGAYPGCGTGPHRFLQNNAAPAEVAPNQVSPDLHLEAAGEPDAWNEQGVLPHLGLMVVYTPEVRTEAGGRNAIEAIIQLAHLQAAEAMEESMAPAVLDLVRMDMVNYDEDAASLDTHLERLAVRGDGFLEEVQTARGLFGADLVMMLVNDMDFGQLCGVAYIPLGPDWIPFDFWNFSVVHWECAPGPAYTFAHELAHNLGAGHDRADPGWNGYHDSSRGFAFVGSSGAEWKTIMARTSAPGVRIPRYSSPYVRYDGEYAGRPWSDPDGADNVMTIRTVAPSTEQARPEVNVGAIVWVNPAFAGGGDGSFDNPFGSLSSALIEVSIGGTIAIQGGAIPGARTLGFPVTLRAWHSDATLGR